MGSERGGQRGLAVLAVSGAAAGTGAGTKSIGRAERVLVLAAFGAVWVVWGSTYLAIAWAVETIPPLLLIGVRCAVAGAVLYVWGRARGGRRPTAREWGAAAVAGVLLFVTGQAVLAWSETRIASGVASLLVATEPLFIAVLAWRGGMLTGTTPSEPSAATVLALTAGFAGAALLTLPGTRGAVDPAGAVAAIAASLSWSLGVFRARSRPGIPAGQNAGMQLLAAGAILLVLAGALGQGSSIVRAEVSARSVAALAYLIVFGSLVAFGAYVWLLDRVGPERLSTHAYVNPLVAIMLGVVLNREPVGASLVAASVLILGSVVVLLTSERGPRARSDARPRRGRRRWLLPSRPQRSRPVTAAPQGQN